MSKDPLIIGGLAGVIANIPKEVLTWIFYGLGMLKFTFVHFCAGLLVNPEYVKSLPGLILGFPVDYLIAASFGIVIYILIKRTGTRLLFLKGIFFGLGVFLICYSMLRPTFSSLKGNTDPLVVVWFLLPNLLYGVTTSLLINKLDGSLKEKDRT